MPLAERVQEWRARDDAYAVDLHDRAASESIDALRLKLCEGALDPTDMLLLCTALGTSLAHSGANPAFVTSVILNIGQLPNSPREAPVASLEAYVREIRELERAAICEGWPRGWVRIDDQSAIAIADAPPDGERAQEWLAKVAAELARSGARHVRITGTSANALGSLLGDFGIRVDYEAGSRK
jgi:hypothetical protein